MFIWDTDLRWLMISVKGKGNFCERQNIYVVFLVTEMHWYVLLFTVNTNRWKYNQTGQSLVTWSYVGMRELKAFWQKYSMCKPRQYSKYYVEKVSYHQRQEFPVDVGLLHVHVLPGFESLLC